MKKMLFILLLTSSFAVFSSQQTEMPNGAITEYYYLNLDRLLELVNNPVEFNALNMFQFKDITACAEKFGLYNLSSRLCQDPRFEEFHKYRTSSNNYIMSTYDIEPLCECLERHDTMELDETIRIKQEKCVLKHDQEVENARQLFEEKIRRCSYLDEGGMLLENSARCAGGGASAISYSELDQTSSDSRKNQRRERILRYIIAEQFKESPEEKLERKYIEALVQERLKERQKGQAGCCPCVVQ